MTDNEIIMRVRLFASQKLVVHQSEGWAIIMKDVLDIIDRQQEEIERLITENNELKMLLEYEADAFDELEFHKKAKREALKRELEAHGVEEIVKSKTAKSIREVLARAREIVKEVTEGKND